MCHAANGAMVEVVLLLGPGMDCPFLLNTETVNIVCRAVSWAAVLLGRVGSAHCLLTNAAAICRSAGRFMGSS